MSAESDRIQEALRTRGTLQAISVTADDTQIRIAGRVAPGGAPQWVLAAHNLLMRSRSAAWAADVSKQYFLKDTGSGPKMFYCWRIILSAPSLKTCVDDIVSAIMSSPKARTEVREIRLGTVSHRKPNDTGKGASSIRGDEGVPAIAMVKTNRLRGGSY